MMIRYFPLRNSIAVLFLYFFWGVSFGQTGPEGIYDDDPMQRLPIGTELSEYYVRTAEGQTIDTSRIDPPFWWVGMNNSRLQIMIHDQGIRSYQVEIQHPGVSLESVDRVENPNYLFVNITIGPGASPGKFPIVLKKDAERKVYDYELLRRRKDTRSKQGLSAADFIYLAMPDRFANGDYANDNFRDMNQWGIHRGKIHFRHGGDLIGVMQHLDYLEELGVTALWLNPVLENDQPYDSYHGYAITDHYNIDARFGTNEQYLQLVRMCHERGIKVIMDIIHNHVGDQHWFIKDLPSEDWIYQPKDYVGTLYRATVWMDPYVASADRKRVVNSWFDLHMPDLNHKNPLLAEYLIQNHIWWTEFSGHDAYRIDTYAYCDQDFMAEWGRRMKEEFPDFNFFGETWVHGIGVQAQFTEDNHLREGYNSNLPAVTDYQLYYAFQDALAGKQGWTDGVLRIYYTLAQDFLYEDPYRNVLFLDNHDLTRFYGVVNEDWNKYESGLSLLMTLRGIPMINYGTELLMTGGGGAFGEPGRVDFPGGWKEDESNKFLAKGRVGEEKKAFNLVKKLANYRKSTTALQHGKLMQYIPEDGVYVYFRYDEKNTVMVLFNSTDEAVKVSTERFRERMFGFQNARNILTDEMIYDLEEIPLDKNQTLILELGT